MKLIFPILIFLSLSLLLPSCGGLSPYVNAKVDTTGAIFTRPDEDGDGIPDEISVPSTQVKPVINEKGLDKINGDLADVIINATK